MTDIKETLKQRGAAYGEFQDIATATQKMKNALRKGSCYKQLPAFAQEGMDMIAHKMARIVMANGVHEDSFRDLAGYAQLIFDRIDEHYNVIKERLDYDPETGVLTWNDVPYAPQLKGKPAGVVHNNGYLMVKVNQKSWTAGRLIWFIQTGLLPHDDLCIDHIDGDKLNNRWSNLRMVTSSAERDIYDRDLLTADADHDKINDITG